MEQKQKKRLDFRSALLAALAWAGAWLGTERDSSAVLLGVGVGALVALWAWRGRRWLFVATGLVLLVMTAMAGLRCWSQELSPLPKWAAEGAVAELEVVIGAGRTGQSTHGEWWQAAGWVREATGRGEHWTTNVEIRLVAGGNLVPAWSAVAVGSKVRATVVLAETVHPESAVAVARAREPPVLLAGPQLADELVEHLHQGLRTASSGLAAQPRALVPALVVGDTSGISTELRESFVSTGLTHLTAVSGANLTILLGCAGFIAARLGARGWWLRVLMLGVVAFFVLLCRGEPSVLRAAAMGGVGVLALGFGQRGQAIRYLAWSVVGLLLIDPWLCRSVGFCLSVAATAGIILWAMPWSLALGRWMPIWAAEAICVPLAAQLATQPIVTALSGQVSLVCVVANILAAPLVAPATILGFAATGVAVLRTGLAAVPATVAGWFAQGVCWIAQWGSAFPGATWSWQVSPVSLAVLAGISLGIALVLPGLWTSRIGVAGLAIGLVFALLNPISAPGWPPTGWAMVVCDVGQGDATVFNAGDGAALVVDTGPDPGSLDRCLRSLGVDQVAVVLTHLHADHVSGLPALLSGRRLSMVVVSSVRKPAPNWADVALAAEGAELIDAAPGMELSFGQVRLEVLAAKPLVDLGQGYDPDSADENDASLVLRVEVAGLSATLGGDIEEAGQRNALSSAGLHADVMLVPHHGSAHQLGQYFEAVRPSLAVISVGAGNGFGHPTPTVLRMLDGIPSYRTDLDGSVAIAKIDGTLHVWASG
jgi:competence protein ComEC